MSYVFYLLNRIPPTTYHFLAWIWLILTLTLSLLSKGTISSLNLWDFVGIDKIGHLGFYAILSFLWFKAMESRSNIAFKIIAGIICFGVFMEYCQYYFTEGRAFEWLDAFANSAGTVLGYFAFVFVTNFRKST